MSNLTPVRSQNLTGSASKGGQLSSGLKERLKRCGRYHTTPPSVKRQCTSGLTSTIGGSPLCTFKASSSDTISLCPKASTPKILAQSIESSNVTDRGDNTTPKPMPRRINTSLCFKSPVMKSPDVKCDLENISSETISGTPLSSRRPDTHRKTHVRNKNLKLNFDCDETGESISRDSTSQDCDMLTLRKEKKELANQIAAHEERLRKLKMVKMYRTKNNLEELQTLIEKWRGVSQQTLQDLHQLLPEPRPSLRQFATHLQLDNDLVQMEFDDDEED